MKKFLLILVIISSQKVLSQEYQPMLVDGKSWEMKRTVYLPQMEYTYFSYYIDGNTSYNGISYFNVKNTDNSFMHFLREDIAQKVVYEYYPNTDTERVLYDFNVAVGDAFNCTFEINNYIICDDGLFTTVVTDIGATEIYGMETTYYDVDFIDSDNNSVIGNFRIIEGFGFYSEGLFSNQCPFCPNDLPEFFVYNMNTMHTMETRVNTASVYYNKFNKQLVLKNGDTPQKIVLYSVLGKKILSKTISDNMDVSQLNYGVYYYSLSSDKGIVKGKLLIE